MNGGPPSQLALKRNMSDHLFFNTNYVTKTHLILLASILKVQQKNLFTDIYSFFVQFKDLNFSECAYTFQERVLVL